MQVRQGAPWGACKCLHNCTQAIIYLGPTVTGPVFLLTWLLYDDSLAARWLAALVPAAMSARFAGTQAIRHLHWCQQRLEHMPMVKCSLFCSCRAKHGSGRQAGGISHGEQSGVTCAHGWCNVPALCCVGVVVVPLQCQVHRCGCPMLQHGVDTAWDGKGLCLNNP